MWFSGGMWEEEVQEMPTLYPLREAYMIDTYNGLRIQKTPPPVKHFPCQCSMSSLKLKERLRQSSSHGIDLSRGGGPSKVYFNIESRPFATPTHSIRLYL